MSSRTVAMLAATFMLLIGCSGTSAPPQVVPSSPTAAPTTPVVAVPDSPATATTGPLADPTPVDAETQVTGDGVLVFTDLAYGDDPAQRVDLAVPSGPGPHPLLIWLHSGGWIVGDKSESPFQDLVDQGVAVASANYRMALTEWPGTFEDPALVVEFLRARAALDGIDPDRVVVAGFSAGGHLAMLTALQGRVDVTAVMSFAGPLDLRDLTNIPGQGGFGASALLALLIDCPIDECPERLADASPSAIVRSDAPPAFVQAGTADPLVNSDVAVDFADAATTEGASVELQVVDGLVHAVDRTPEAIAFLATHLGLPLSP